MPFRGRMINSGQVCKKDMGIQVSLGSMTISEKEFHLMRSLIYERFGINLSEKKRTFIVSRLQKLLRAEGYESFRQYYDSIIADKSGKALAELANFISTNYTFFNRERAHFDYFVNTALPVIVQRLRRQKSNDIRIWCAGCSSGEEPYMLAMLLLEYFSERYVSWNAGILATDISSHALSLAKSGVYTDEQVNLVPEVLRKKYFIHQSGDQWAVKECVKKEVTFRHFNLMNRTFPFRQSFHIIFCRNVMIYFDAPTREKLIYRFFKQTAQDGYLFIGHSESLPRDRCPYCYIKPAVYQRTGSLQKVIK